jgi:hypothetical protein
VIAVSLRCEQSLLALLSDNEPMFHGLSSRDFAKPRPQLQARLALALKLYSLDNAIASQRSSIEIHHDKIDHNARYGGDENEQNEVSQGN